MPEPEDISFAILFVIGLCFGFFIGSYQNNDSWQKKLIEKGLAEYNSVNGEWQWKEADDAGE